MFKEEIDMYSDSKETGAVRKIVKPNQDQETIKEDK